MLPAGRRGWPSSLPVLLMSLVMAVAVGGCTTPFMRYDLAPLPRAEPTAPRLYAQVRQAGMAMGRDRLPDSETAYSIDITNRGDVPVTIYPARANLRGQAIGQGPAVSAPVLAAGPGTFPDNIPLRKLKDVHVVLPPGASTTLWVAFAPLRDEAPVRQLLALPINPGSELAIELHDPRHAPRWTQTRTWDLTVGLVAHTRNFGDGPTARTFYPLPWGVKLAWAAEMFRASVTGEFMRLHESGTDSDNNAFWFSTEVAWKPRTWFTALFLEGSLIDGSLGDTSYDTTSPIFGLTAGLSLPLGGSWLRRSAGWRIGYTRLFGDFPGNDGVTIGLEVTF